MFLRLACKSLLSRKASIFITLLAMTISITVMLGVEHIRHQAKSSFASTVSGVDLIVGARTSSLNLLLYSVFRIGSPTNNIRWESYKNIEKNPNVRWAIPISLGDSHKGYRVLGTTQNYFEHFRYGQKHSLEFVEGKAFSEPLHVVLGATVAKKLNYQLGDKIIIAHGLASTSFSLHDDHPFTVVGILSPTGTPVDQTVHVSLAGIEAIHIGWQNGVKQPGYSAEKFSEISELTPSSLTAVMLGLKSKIATFKVQRELNQYRGEPLVAILPGVALSELWQMMAVLENTLRLIAILVFISALLGLTALQLASIRERILEMHLLRTIGASSFYIFSLVLLESVIVAVLASILSSALLMTVILATQSTVASSFGIFVSSNIFYTSNILLILFICLGSLIAALIPGVVAALKSPDN